MKHLDVANSFILISCHTYTLQHACHVVKSDELLNPSAVKSISTDARVKVEWLGPSSCSKHAWNMVLIVLLLASLPPSK